MSASSASDRIRDALRLKLLPNQYPPLHGLRVIAITLVVQLHTTVVLLSVGLVSFSTHLTWFAMDLFFFLSGFLIGSLLLADAPSGSAVNMRRFYLRRAFRTFPSYWIVLTLLALVWPMNELQRAHLWMEYAYLTNYVPPWPGLVVMSWGWSLALEEHFYLLVPLLVGALRSIRSRFGQLLVLGLLWLSAPILRAWVFVTHGPWDFPRMLSVFYVRSHLRYDILIAGIFTACLQRYYARELAEWLRRPSRRVFLGSLSACGFALLLFTGRVQLGFLPYNLLCWGTVTSLAYMPLVLLLLNHDGAVARALSHRRFAQIATVGYGIYLIHVPVIEAIVVPWAIVATRGTHVRWQILWPLAVVSSLLLAALGGYILHLLIEKPALKLRDRWCP